MASFPFRFTGNFAANYDLYLGPLLFEPSAIQFVDQIKEPNASDVLELSCGTGRLTRHLANYFSPDTKITATDLSADMIAVAKESVKFSNVNFVEADAQELPFDDDRFDLVLWQYGIMFLNDKAKGLSEALRVLRPGGKLIFATWNSTASMPLFNLMIDKVIVPFFPEENPDRFRLPFSMYDHNLLKQLPLDAGFQHSEVLALSFASPVTSYETVIQGMFLEHPLGRQVIEKDPSALEPMGAIMLDLYEQTLGGESISFELKAFIVTAEKI